MTNQNDDIALKNSFGFTLVFWFLLLSIIPASFISYRSYIVFVEDIKISALKQLNKHSELNKKFIDNWFDNRKVDVTSWSKSKTTVSFMEELNGKYKKYKTAKEYLKSDDYKKIVEEGSGDLLTISRQYNYIYDIFLIDEKGNILYSVAKEDDIGTNLIDGAHAKTKFASSFKNSLSDNSLRFSDLQRYEPSKSVITGFVTTPIVSENGETVGVFAVQLNLKTIFSLFDSFMESNGGSYSSYLVGEDKLLRSNINENAKALEFKVDTRQFTIWQEEHIDKTDTTRDENEERLYEYKGPFGNDVIGLHADLNIYGTEWALMHEIKEDTLLMAMNKHLNEMIFILLVTVITVVVAALVIASNITGPIKKLLTATLELAEGNLDYRCDIASKNEIGKLAQSFKEMSESLKSANLEIEAQNTKLLQMAIHDKLTGLYNRHHLAETGNKIFAKAKRHSDKLSVIMSDIDHFKEVNDTYGHLDGDKVLVAMGRLLSENKRSEDVIARYGGEEFVIILENCDTTSAKEKAEEIRVAISKLEIDGICVTASFGIAQLNSQHKDFDSLLNDADEALYRAKESGRNRVVVFDKTL